MIDIILSCCCQITKYMTFKCHNYQSKSIKCGAHIAIRLEKDANGECKLRKIEETEHCQECVMCQISINERERKYREYITYIIKYMPYLTKSQVGLLFGFDGTELDELEYLLKTEKEKMD